MKARRLWAIMLKELRQLRRDRLTFGMIVGIPALQLLLFGYAISLEVKQLDAALLDHAHSAQSRQVAEMVAHSQVLNFVRAIDSPAEVEPLLRRGEVSAIVVIPRDFERRMQSGQPALQIVVDGADPAVQAAARQLAALPLPGAREVAPAIEVVNFYNPERRAAVATVPGLIGVILTMTMILFTAIAIVRERERGNLEMVMTTPIRPMEFLLGKLSPYLVIGLVQVTLVLILGVTVFGVPIRGALHHVYLATLLFILANLALGVLISTVARTQFQAMQMTMFLLLPSILLSGFAFPFAGMPRPAQWLAEVLPLTHYVRISRSLILRAADLGDMASELAVLGVMAVVFLLLALSRFHKRLD
jgi:ABC-2 type transport system permease protein